jgi:hypothetical protein
MKTGVTNEELMPLNEVPFSEWLQFTTKRAQRQKYWPKTKAEYQN